MWQNILVSKRDTTRKVCKHMDIIFDGLGGEKDAN